MNQQTPELDEDVNRPQQGKEKRRKMAELARDDVCASLRKPEQPQPCIKTLVTQNLWSDDESTVESALIQLSTVCSQPDTAYAYAQMEKTANDCRAEIYSLGGHLAIVKSLEKFPQTAKLHRLGLTALGKLVVRQPDGEIRFAVAAVGGAEVCVAAMKRFRTDPVLQASGCFLLGQISDHCDDAKHVVNEIKGHFAIVCAMKAFPHDARVQKWGCRAILTMSNVTALVWEIVAAGGRSAVANAADNHPGNSDIQVGARWATMNLWGLM